jgi:tRNA(adenine34) deaminase
MGTLNSEVTDGGQKAHMPKRATKPRKRWSAKVRTDSTHPPVGLFNKDAATIARTLASKKVSPKGPGSGMRMLTFFINRAGRNLSPTRRRVLERAKKLLSQRIHDRAGSKAR